MHKLLQWLAVARTGETATISIWPMRPHKEFVFIYAAAEHGVSPVWLCLHLGSSTLERISREVLGFEAEGVSLSRRRDAHVVSDVRGRRVNVTQEDWIRRAAMILRMVFREVDAVRRMSSANAPDFLVGAARLLQDENVPLDMAISTAEIACSSL